MLAGTRVKQLALYSISVAAELLEQKLNDLWGDKGYMTMI